ncbi:MAG: 5'-nucleotidase C-terminal domain-containing protein, partial [Chitinophagales bacterium]|nr:5'-nucleotidase C-terminal domain-containing protein [Chitinophagales bacterium]
LLLLCKQAAIMRNTPSHKRFHQIALRQCVVFLLIANCLFIFSCKTYRPVRYQTQQNKIAQTQPDEKLAAIIRPYKDELDKEMNVVLAESDTVLTKATPESDLGNLMCDLILKKSRDYCNCPVDFTFLNNGGIRIPNLPKGKITYGKIMELMPFDNQIVIMKIPGKTLDTLFSHMAAKGGWQVSGARYAFKGGKLLWVYIQGDTLQANKTYTAAVSDYLAQGGDNCTFLTSLPKTTLQQNLRDALVDGLREMQLRGEKVKSIIDGRVKKIE